MLRKRERQREYIYILRIIYIRYVLCMKYGFIHKNYIHSVIHNIIFIILNMLNVESYIKYDTRCTIIYIYDIIYNFLLYILINIFSMLAHAIGNGKATYHTMRILRKKRNTHKSV